MTKPVLVVDPDPHVVSRAEQALSGTGCDVWRALDDLTAYQVIDQEGARLKVLIADVKLRGRMSGLAVARRARACNPGIHVIHWGEPPAGLDKAGLPPAIFMPKPIDFDRLVELVSALVAA